MSSLSFQNEYDYYNERWLYYQVGVDATIRDPAYRPVAYDIDYDGMTAQIQITWGGEPGSEYTLHVQFWVFPDVWWQLYSVDDWSITLPPRPTITGSNSIWWFGSGISPSGFDTTLDLYASGNGTWNVNRSDVVSLTDHGTWARIVCTGQAFSDSRGDVGVTVTIDGVTSDTFQITALKPSYLEQMTDPVDEYDYYNYWKTEIAYFIRDQFGDDVCDSGRSVDYNEKWLTGENGDYEEENWGQNEETPGHLTFLLDVISAPGRFNIPPNFPEPDYYGEQVPVVHWGQAWYIGSQDTGSGIWVQSNTLQKYICLARHLFDW